MVSGIARDRMLVSRDLMAITEVITVCCVLGKFPFDLVLRVIQG